MKGPHRMHPDVEPYAKAYAEKQERFWATWRRVQELNVFNQRENITSLSPEYQRAFNDWIEASDDLDEAVAEMRERALGAAGFPKDHPWRPSQRETTD